MTKNSDLDTLPTSVKLLPTEETPLIAPARKNNATGYVLMLVSTMFFSFMSLLVHLAQQSYSVPAPTTIFFRGVVDTVVSSSYIFVKLNPLSILSGLSTRDRILLAVRGCFGSLILVTLFTSLHHLPLGEAITIFFTGPVFTLLLSHFTLGEPLAATDLLAGIVSIIGVGLIAYQPEEKALPGAIRSLGILLAVGSALFAAVAFTTVRALSNKIHFMVSIFALGIFTLGWSIALGGALPLSEMIRLKEGIGIAFLAAISASTGQMCFDKGLQLCRAGPGTLIRNVDVPASYVLGLLFLHEQPSWASFWGSCLVLCSTLIIGIRQIRNM